jgi:hypothetical protein
MTLHVQKPWGSYIEHWRASDNSCVLKTLIVNPGQELSWQYHELRSEIWHVQGLPDGVPHEIVIGREKMSNPGHGLYLINSGQLHTIRNLHPTVTLYVSEMQYGECREEDIVRVFDPYQRP